MTRDDLHIRNALHIEIGDRALFRSLFRPGRLPLGARLASFLSSWAGV